jgi:hypothetical protein
MKDQLTISSEADNRNSAICRFTLIEHYTLERRALMTEVKPSNPCLREAFRH